MTAPSDTAAQEGDAKGSRTNTKSLRKDYRAITIWAGADRTFAGKRCSDDDRVID